MMSTKEQERKALEKIEKIIAELGEGSYIGTAFEGCFEIAKENIENDFACSMKQRWETAEQACDMRREQAYKQEEKIKELQAKVDFMKEKLDGSHELSESLAHKFENAMAERNAAREASTEYWNKLQEAETKLDEKEDEIIRLKAKLFDMMMAQK